MKHYVVIHDYAAESGENHQDVSSGTEIVGVVHSLKKAKEKLATASADEKQYAKEHGWVIHVDTDSAFAAGEKDNYDREHCDFYIEEVDEETDDIAISEVLKKIDKIEDATLEHYRGNITRERYITDVKVIYQTVSDYVSRTEPSDTDFALVRKLAEIFQPATRGIITNEEKELVANTLELASRNVRELRNLRNTFVMASDISAKDIDYISAVTFVDYISAVTFVIDEAIINRDGEV